MTRAVRRWLVLATVAVAAGGLRSDAQRPSSMDDDCNPALIRQAAEDKAKSWRAAGVPEELISSLLGRLPQCVHCIRDAPDKPWIVFDWTPGQEPKDSGGMSLTGVSWTPTQERIARGEVKVGMMRSFKIVPYTGTCVCRCGSGGRISTNGGQTAIDGETIGITVNSSNVGNPPPYDVSPETIPHTPEPTSVKPAKKSPSVHCPACQDLASAYNALADALDAEWDKLIAAERDMWQTENDMIDKENALDQLVAQMQLAHTIDAAKIEEGHDAIRADWEKLGRQTAARDRLKANIDQMTSALAALAAALQVCEETKCPPLAVTPAAGGAVTGTPPPPPAEKSRAPLVATGDVNGDGNLDIVSAVAGAAGAAAHLTILLGLGDGTFAMPQTIAVAGHPTALAVKDLDGNGRAGIVVGTQTASGAGEIDIYRSIVEHIQSMLDANPITILPDAKIDLASAPTAVAVGRFDDDEGIAFINPHGDLGIVTAKWSGSTPTIHLVPGVAPPSFWPMPGLIGAGPLKTGAAASDVDDVFVAAPGGGFTAFNFKVPEVLHFGPDGHVWSDDILKGVLQNGPMSNIGGPLESLRYSFEASPITVQQVFAMGGPFSNAYADPNTLVSTIIFDEGGTHPPTLLTLNPATGLLTKTLYFFHNGDELGIPVVKMGPEVLYAIYASGGRAVATGDINGDGIPDVVVGGGSGGGPFVMLGGGGGGGADTFAGGGGGGGGFAGGAGGYAGAEGAVQPNGPSSVVAGHFDNSAPADGVAAVMNDDQLFMWSGGKFVASQTFPAVSLSANLDSTGGSTDVAIPDQGSSIVLAVQVHGVTIKATIALPSSAGGRDAVSSRAPRPWFIAAPRVMNLFTQMQPAGLRWSPQSRTGAAAARPLTARILSLGASTGEAFTAQFTNNTQRPIKIAESTLAIEPVSAPKSNANAPAARGVATNTESGYCLDFTKAVPAAGTPYRIASPDAQRAMRPIRNVLRAADRLAKANLLHPDSDPAAYADAIKQWAVWAKRNGWDMAKFGEAFVERTKKNLAEMKQKWTPDVEALVRGLIPNRWRDIQAVFTDATRMK